MPTGHAFLGQVELQRCFEGEPIQQCLYASHVAIIISQNVVDLILRRFQREYLLRVNLCYRVGFSLSRAHILVWRYVCVKRDWCVHDLRLHQLLLVG